MNNGPTLSIWIQLCSSLALEGSLIFLVAYALQYFVRSATWRRVLWQTVMVGFSLIIVLEITGTSHATAGLKILKAHSIQPANIRPTRAFAVSKPVLENRLMTLEQQLAAPQIMPAIQKRPDSQPAWWPGLVWLAGVILVASRAALSHIILFFLRVRGQSKGEAKLSEQIEFLARLMDLRKRIRVSCLKGLTGPVAFGIIRPTIGVPEGFEGQFSPEQREAMLIHELAHLNEHDPFWFIVSDLIAVVLWWHPLVWLARDQFRAASETAADEASLLLENGPDTLAECLVLLGRRLGRPKAFGWLSIEGNGFRSRLGQRVSKLLQMTGRVWLPTRGFKGGLVKFSGPVLLTMAAIACAGWGLPNSHERGTLAQGWDHSLVRVTFQALNASATDPDHAAGSGIQLSHDAIPGALRDVQAFLETDRFAQAEALLDEVLKAEPANKAAKELWEELEQKKATRGNAAPLENKFTNTPLSGFQAIAATNELRVPRTSNIEGPISQGPTKLAIWNTTSPSRFSVNEKGQAREKLWHKLNDIRLERFGFQGTPLSEVVNVLREEAQKRDPEKAGVNFLINSDSAGVSEQETNELLLTATRIHIWPPLRNVSLLQALDAVIHIADRPIKYLIEDHAVLFSSKPPENPPLHTRVFKVDPATFIQGLRSVHSASAPARKTEKSERWSSNAQHFAGVTSFTFETNQTDLANPLHNFFAAGGVSSDPPKSLFFNDRSGMIVVRATLADLDIIEKAIQMLNASPAQVTIEAKFCEITDDSDKALGMDWLPAATPQSNSQTATTSGVLTEKQFRAVLKTLKQRSGVDLLATPKVTTLSGRRAQMKVVDVKYIVSDLDISTNYTETATGALPTTVMQPITEPMEFGPVLDVVPTVAGDGFTVALAVSGTIKEFLGYDDAEGFIASVREADGNKRSKGPKTTTTPLPKIRLGQISTSAAVLDGQTLVLAGGAFDETVKTKDKVPLLGDLPLAGKLFQSESSITMKKKLLIFITPTIIDPAGNRVHSEEEISTKGVPHGSSDLERN